MIKYCLILTLSLCVLAACSEKSSSDKKGAAVAVSATEVLTGTPTEVVQKTIKRYNQLLAEGYQKLNMTNLQEVATDKLAMSAYYHAAALTEGKSRMITQMKDIDFIKVDFDQPEKARVVSKETWDFAYVDIQTGAKKQEVKDYVYHVAYALNKVQGKWIINEVTATGEDRQEMPSWNTIFKDAGQQPAGQPQPSAPQMPPGHPPTAK